MSIRGFRILVVIVAVIAAISGCKGNGNSVKKDRVVRNPLSTAEETVRAYCELDAKGVRLTSKTWSKVLPYISWKEEMGWDRLTVISDFEVGAPEKKKERLAVIPVTFRVIGTLAQDYRSAATTERVTFTLKRTDAGWKIVSPDSMQPHVYINPVVTHLEETKNFELARKVQTGGNE